MRVPLQHFQAAVAVVVLAVLSAGAALPAAHLPEIASMGLLARLVLALFVVALGGGLLDAVARPPRAMHPWVNRVRSGDASE